MIAEPMLTDEEIAALVDKWYDNVSDSEGIIREAVRLTAERCAEICERDLCNRPDDHPANYFDGGLRHCAAAIRERIKDKPGWFDPNSHGRGGI